MKNKIPPSKQVKIDFIEKHIEKGTSYSKTLAAVGGKWQIGERTFDRYWRIAQEQHSTKQQALKIAKWEVDKAEAISVRKSEIMDAHERKALLTQIAKGEIIIPTVAYKWDPVKEKFVTVPVKLAPSHAVRISSISELNKMEGDYAPTKIAETDTDGKDKEPSFIQWGGNKIVLK